MSAAAYERNTFSATLPSTTCGACTTAGVLAGTTTPALPAALAAASCLSNRAIASWFASRPSRSKTLTRSPSPSCIKASMVQGPSVNIRCLSSCPNQFKSSLRSRSVVTLPRPMAYRRSNSSPVSLLAAGSAGLRAARRPSCVC